jgi:hypothetical protein
MEEVLASRYVVGAPDSVDFSGLVELSVADDDGGPLVEVEATEYRAACPRDGALPRRCNSFPSLGL